MWNASNDVQRENKQNTKYGVKGQRYIQLAKSFYHPTKIYEIDVNKETIKPEISNNSYICDKIKIKKSFGRDFDWERVHTLFNRIISTTGPATID